MIGFIAAERLEFSGLARHVRDLRRLPWPIRYAASGTLNGRPVILAANGPGPDLARKASDLLKTGDLEALVSIGFCGALSERLLPSEVFVATSVNGVAVVAPPTAPTASSGPLLSLNRVVSTVEEKRKLGNTGAEVVEMEAGEVRAAAGTMASFYCIRVVTDTALENLPMDFNALRDKNGRFSRGRIAVSVLGNPFKLVPELMRFDRRCRGAALVLGDFIANCQF